MISLIINTCAMEPGPRFSGKYKDRAYALQNFIIPQYVNDPYIDEIIVVGSWQEGEGYKYIPCPSKYFSCVDALEQRQRGFEASTGDIVIFQHDDHVLEKSLEYYWVDGIIYHGMQSGGCDVLSPACYTRLRYPDGERLNAGEPGFNEWVPPGGHLNGHCAIFNRDVIERCPGTNADKVFTWDVSMTHQIRKAGFEIAWSNMIRCWDIEKGSTPWV